LDRLLKKGLCHAMSAAADEAFAPWFGPFTQKPRARYFAEFTLSRQSKILRCAQDDNEGLRMTAKGQV